MDKTERYKKAAENYLKAAKVGTRRGGDALKEMKEDFCAFGDSYYEGKGVDQDYELAVYWYKLAAELGDRVAQTKLGNCYDNGTGVPRDQHMAKYWWVEAAKRGGVRAKQILDERGWM